MGNGNIEEYIKWKRKNDPENKSPSTIGHHNINNSTGNNKFNNDPNKKILGKETGTSLKDIEPRPLNKKKDEKKGILNILKIPLRKKATEEEKREATAQVKKKTPQSLKPGKLRHGKRKSRLKFRQNVKIKNQVTTNRKKRDAEAKKKPVKENFPMSEEDKNYILTGKDRPTEESIKKKVKAAKAKDSGQELKETEEDVKKKKKKMRGGHRGKWLREKEAKETFKGGKGGTFNKDKDSGTSGGWKEKHKPLQGRI